MDENWQYGSPGSTPAADADEQRNTGWARRPRRSVTDRKIAGVAGGLGRAFGIDPVLIRVIFVVLAIFGGFGGLLYVLGWLLLPGDHDETSAAEALLGRGRSSVPPVLAVGLGIVAVISLFSMFSWGLPFFPLVIIGVVVVAIVRRRGARYHWEGAANWNDAYAARWQHRAEQQARRWDAHAERDARRWGARAERWSRQASQWGDQAERWVGTQPWSCGGGRAKARNGGAQARPGSPTDTPASSPFDRPAFWDEPTASMRVDSPPPSGVRMTKPGRRDTTPGPTHPSGPADAPVDLTKDAMLADLDAARTPPAWDPLGVAPFAWDLPEPSPVPAPPVRRNSGGAVISRVTMGLALLAGGLAAAGIFAGWWALSWAQVAAVALTVVALGLLVSALRGRGYALVGPGVFLSLVTLALTMTGISGTSGFGQFDLKPDYASVQPRYAYNAGELNLDLSNVEVPVGRTLPIAVDMHAGHAVITLPEDTQVNVTCTANAGQVDCLDRRAQGLRRTTTAQQTGDPAEHGTIELTVEMGTGYAQVRND